MCQIEQYMCYTFVRFYSRTQPSTIDTPDSGSSLLDC